MKNNPQEAVTNNFRGGAQSYHSDSGSAFLGQMGHAKISALGLIAAVLLTLGCSTADKRFNARWVSSASRLTIGQTGAGYQPARSPAFSDFLGS